jgi:hypothetical protein
MRRSKWTGYSIVAPPKGPEQEGAGVAEASASFMYASMEIFLRRINKNAVLPQREEGG